MKLSQSRVTEANVFLDLKRMLVFLSSEAGIIPRDLDQQQVFPMFPRNVHQLRTSVHRAAQYFLLVVFATTGVVVGLEERLHADLPKWVPEVHHLTLLLIGILASELILELAVMNQRVAKLESTETEEALGDLPKNERERVRATVKDYVIMRNLIMRTARSNPQFGQICTSILREQRAGLQGLAQARLEVPQNQFVLAQQRLMTFYHAKFEAVSEKDFDFWGEQSRAYEDVISNCMREFQTQVSRIFVLTKSELCHYTRELAITLARQHVAGIALGCTVLADDDRKVKELGCRLDFALYDEGQAISFFRRGDPRNIEGIFCTPGTYEQIIRYQQLFKYLVDSCWIVNTAFRARYLPAISANTSSKAPNGHTAVTAELVKLLSQNPEPGAEPYFFGFSDPKEITSKLEALCRAVERPYFNFTNVSR